MNREDIIRMARGAGLYSGNPRTPGTENTIVRRLTRFAALVAAAEREACAKACDAEVVRLDMTGESRAAIVAGICAAAIRSRGEVKP